MMIATVAQFSTRQEVSLADVPSTAAESDFKIAPDMAQGLVRLLETIESDTDTHPDWIEAVCMVFDALPEGTIQSLRSRQSDGV